MDTTEKLNMLKKRANDKSLSRAERKEAMNEYKAAYYRVDKRKPISVRKQMMINALQAFLMTFNFGAMGTIDYLRYLYGYDYKIHLLGTLSVLIVLSFVVLLGLVLFVQDKYKQEPDDELSLKNKTLASNLGYVITAMATIIGIFIYFDILGKESLVIRREYGVFWAASYISLMTLAGKIIFLIIDGKDTSGDDDDEEETVEE